MASGMACSCEQLVMGNEIIGMTKRFVEGITGRCRNPGPRRHRRRGARREIFWPSSHTVDHLRKELWQARLLNRQPIDCMEERPAEKPWKTVSSEEVRQISSKTISQNRWTAKTLDELASAQKRRGKGNPGTDGKRLIRLGGRTRHIRHRLFNQIFRRLQLSDPTLCISIHLMIALTGT
jgi:trimethylamine--corrinoid protein Co-methyltransferase